MESIGELLQQEREQRGITLVEVASKTKISIGMLKAIEANDFTQIPSEVFARGYVLSYAKCLGLNEKEIFERFRESTADFYAKIPEAEISHPPPIQDPERKKKVSRLLTIGGFTAVVILMVFVFYSWSVLSGSSTEKGLSLTPAMISDSSDVLQENTSTIGLVKGEAIRTPVEMTVNVPGLPVPKLEDSPASMEDLILVIEASEQSWIMAKIDDATIKEVLLQPGDVVRWKAQEKFVLTLGNAGGVNLELNGNTLDPLGPKGKVVKNIILTR